MRFDTPNHWLNWLEGLHPKAIDLGLERVAEVWRRLALDLAPARVISVAGTNGKGSSVALLEAIYGAAGYRVGAYTSPHLLIYNERIRLEGRLVTDAELCAAFERVDQARGEISLTYFEFGTLAALSLFAEARLDLVILEVGLGGRLDAVNIIDADLALISSIDYDHQDWLGSDIDQIAREKGGIMRPGQPAVFNGAQPPAGLVQLAGELGVALYLAERDYRAEFSAEDWRWSAANQSYNQLPLPALRGPHQRSNAAAVLMAVQLLQGPLPVGEQALAQGLRQVQVPGRFQRIGLPRSVSPQMAVEVDIYLDVAHNPQGARALAASLDELSRTGALLAVFGLLADKDAAGVIAPLCGQVDAWFVGRPLCQRGCDPQALLRELQHQGCSKAQGFAQIAQAFAAARQAARPGDRILVFGSFYTVAEVMSLL
jgi:dihydrofolate synthase/folylpolyglutamate synthase